MATASYHEDEPTADDQEASVRPGTWIDPHDHDLPRRRWLSLQGVPAWLISTLLHVLILLLLGAISLTDPVRIVNVLSATAPREEGPEIEEFRIEEVDLSEAEELEEFVEPVDMAASMEIEVAEIEIPIETAALAMQMSELASEITPQVPFKLESLSKGSMSTVGSRSGDMKSELLRTYGGNASSEAAVTDALKWFARHQLPNGAWTFHHNLVCNNGCGNPGEVGRHRDALNAATALALLPFLGAGQTHREGQFKQVVYRGLRFLARNGNPGKVRGISAIDYQGEGDMYSHGLAAIALCEAYAMTKDPELAGPAQGALNFIQLAQCRDGGWRYRPADPRGGDTSVYGWQLMALKSGHMGHLEVSPVVIRDANMFLNRMQTKGGAGYRYASTSGSDKISTTSIGLLCRMYLGWDKTNPALIEGAAALSKRGVSKSDLYYNYYAAQVLRQLGGPDWDKFNQELRDWLVDTQVKSGEGKGSWFHGDNGHVPSKAGRLGVTSFATMILEVYYRHMPLYADQVVEDEFPL